MTEREKIVWAKTYVDKLANGIDPLTDRPVPDEDLLNNVKISRCLFFVSEVLRKHMENSGPPSGKEKKAPFELDHAARRFFRYSEKPIPISEIALRINELIQPGKMKKLSYKCILEWLVQAGFLLQTVDGAGKPVRRPSGSGIELGIATEERRGQDRTYTVVVYNRMAQQFILDNLDAAIELSRR